MSGHYDEARDLITEVLDERRTAVPVSLARTGPTASVDPHQITVAVRRGAALDPADEVSR